ncbi:MAG: type II toxin-antitoxin system RelE/ParE family toxin [Bacteroidia bacterium]
MVEIIWTKRAAQQFERAVKYISKDRGTYYANIVRLGILEKVDVLKIQPTIGSLEPLLSHKKYEYRFLVKWSYKIIYRHEKDHAIISRIFHTSRNPKNLKGV